MPRKAITTGNANTDHEAIAWLQEHGAEAQVCLGVTVIILPETALVERDGYDWRYTIGFHDKDGNLENNFVEIELDVDANATLLRLKQETLEAENEGADNLVNMEK